MLINDNQFKAEECRPSLILTTPLPIVQIVQLDINVSNSLLNGPNLRLNLNAMPLKQL